MENHIIKCNYCHQEQIIVHPTETPKHKVFCPICRTQMVPSRVECEDGSGWMFGWLCACNEEMRGAL